jgi:DNA-binding IclR family transcriptional regulator
MVCADSGSSGGPRSNVRHQEVLLAEMPVEKVIAMLPEKLEAYTEHTITDRTVLLREPDQVREQGFGIIDNELEEELISL